MWQPGSTENDLPEARHVLPVDRRDRPEQARHLFRRARRRGVRVKRVRLSAPRDAAGDQPRSAQQRRRDSPASC